MPQFLRRLAVIGITVVAVGKMKEQFFKDAFREYEKRLGGYCEFRCVEIPESTLDKEADTMVKYIPKCAHVIAMCVEGKKMSSQALAEYIRLRTVAGDSRIVFIVGGSTGLSEKIKNMADLRLSVSDMTFPHHLFRVILMEQIYRSFKIIEGSSYHK